MLIDCDPAIGVRNRDVDDALAVLMVLASPTTRLEGITINFGNVATDVGVGVATDLLERIGADIPLLPGASSRAERGNGSAAVDFLIDTVRASPGEISLLTLAPLTNVATAMSLDPTFAANLRELVVMGGSLNFKPFCWVGEFNFHLDGASAAQVMAAPVPKTLITMDVCSQVVFRPAQLAQLRSREGAMARYLSESIDPWLRLNRRVFFRAGGFFPWDAVAAARLLDASLFDRRDTRVSVRPRGLRSGQLSLSDQAHSLSSAASPLVDVPTTLNADGFMTAFMDALLSFC